MSCGWFITPIPLASPGGFETLSISFSLSLSISVSRASVYSQIRCTAASRISSHLAMASSASWHHRYTISHPESTSNSSSRYAASVSAPAATIPPPGHSATGPAHQLPARNNELHVVDRQPSAGNRTRNWN